MPAPMPLRPARVHDAAALAAFAGRAFTDTYGDVSDAAEIEAYVAEHFTVARMQSVLQDPACAVLLAEDGHALAGYGILQFGQPPACVTGPRPVKLWRLYLGAGHIGQGLGLRMMQALQAEARSRQGSTLWLSVYDRNVRAVRFYERCGFRHVGGLEFEFGGCVYIDPVYALPLDDRA